MKLADMGTQLHAARLMTLDAAVRKDSGERPTSKQGWRSCSRVRPRSRSRLNRCASTAGSLHDRASVERYYRDAPLMIIGEGTNEISAS